MQIDAKVYIQNAQMCASPDIVKSVGSVSHAPDCIELGELKMSRSFKHEKSTGFLEHAAKIRRDRKLIRDLKADMLIEKFDADIDTDFTFSTLS